MTTRPSLKVGLVFDDSLDSNDGVAQHVKTLGAWLSSQNHHVVYLVGETKLEQWAGDKVYSLAKNQTVYFNGNKLSIPLPANSKKIRRILESENFDVIHVMMPYSPFLAQKIIKLASARTVIIGTFHIFPSGHLSEVGARLLRLIYGRSLKRFNSIISVSAPAASFAKAAFGLDSQIIPNPVDVNKYSRFNKKQRLTNSNRIVFLGRLVKRKGARQLLEAFAVLIKDLPEAQLTIAGNGPQRSNLEKLARNLGLNQKVEFTGYIEESEKPRLLSSADLACFPSLYGESFGIVLIEAMAAGARIVLGGDNLGYRSILNSKPLLLVDPNNTQLVAKRLYDLLTDKAIQRSVYRWQQIQLKKYDINTVGPHVLAVYKQQLRA